MWLSCTWRFCRPHLELWRPSIGDMWLHWFVNYCFGACYLHLYSQLIVHVMLVFVALRRWYVHLHFGYKSAQSWVRYHQHLVLTFGETVIYQRVICDHSAIKPSCLICRHSLIIPKRHCCSLDATPPSVSSPYENDQFYSLALQLIDVTSVSKLDKKTAAWNLVCICQIIHGDGLMSYESLLCECAPSHCF